MNGKYFGYSKEQEAAILAQLEATMALIHFDTRPRDELPSPLVVAVPGTNCRFTLRNFEQCESMVLRLTGGHSRALVKVAWMLKQWDRYGNFGGHADFARTEMPLPGMKEARACRKENASFREWKPDYLERAARVEECPDGFMLFDELDNVIIVLNVGQYNQLAKRIARDTKISKVA